MLIYIIQKSSSLISDKVLLHCLLVSTTLRLLSISSKSISNSLKKFSISPYSFTQLETHLCNPTSSPISANPFGSPLNQFNSISPAKTPDGYSFSHHFDQNFSSFSSKIGFCKVSSSGYWLSVCLVKIIFANLFYYLAYFSTIYGPHYTFWYYSWVSLYYFS